MTASYSSNYIIPIISAGPVLPPVDMVKTRPTEPEHPSPPLEESKCEYAATDLTEHIREKKLAPPPEFATYNFPDVVKERATVIWHGARLGSKRGKNRVRGLFFSLLSAHGQLGIVAVPNQIAKIVGLPTNMMQAAQKSCSVIRTGFDTEATTIYHTAVDFLPTYAGQLGITSDVATMMVQAAQKILTKDASLGERPPQVVAAAMIKYLLPFFSVVIDDKMFDTIVGLSQSTIKVALVEIAMADNKKA